MYIVQAEPDWYYKIGTVINAKTVNEKCKEKLFFHFLGKPVSFASNQLTNDVDFLDHSLEVDIGVDGKFTGECACSRSFFILSLGLKAEESRSKDEA